MKVITGILILIALLVIAFVTINTYIYNEKQLEDTETTLELGL